MATTLQLPLRSARECERFAVGGHFLGILYDEIEEWGGAAIDYRYALAVFHRETDALPCMVTTETSPSWEHLKALPAQFLDPMGVGSEALALWDGSGRRIVGLDSFSSVASFKDRALSLVRGVLGLEELT